VSDYGVDCRGSIPDRIFPLTSASRPALGPTQPPVQWVPGALSPGVKGGRGVMLTTHPLLVPRLRKSRSYTSSHTNAPLWSVTGPLYLFFYFISALSWGGVILEIILHALLLYLKVVLQTSTFIPSYNFLPPPPTPSPSVNKNFMLILCSVYLSPVFVTSHHFTQHSS
jgi:hypothetical protein